MTRQILGAGRDRAEYGCIVSFENENGLTFVVARKGPVEKALREALAIALSHDESFRVVCLSTPQTIFTDMDGGRSDIDNRDGYRSSLPLPEIQIQMLGRIKAKAMLHPRLASPHRDARRA